MNFTVSAGPALQHTPESSCVTLSPSSAATSSQSPSEIFMPGDPILQTHLLPSAQFSSLTNVASRSSTANVFSGTTVSAKRKRKRKSTTMIIKPTRWTPLAQCHYPSSDSTTINNVSGMASSSIQSNFKPTFYNPNEIKHRRRISSDQYGILETEYQINTKPNASKRHQLAEKLGMTPRTVQIWFQNKRAKAKQHLQQDQRKYSTITQPTRHYEPLSPTSPLTKTISPPSLSPSSLMTTTVDLITFDDGRLDPVYLMHDHQHLATCTTNSTNTTAFVSHVGSPLITQNGILPPSTCTDKDEEEGDASNAADVAPMAASHSKGTANLDSHGTSESPSLSGSETPGTYDDFTIWLCSNTNQLQFQDTAMANDTLPSAAASSTGSSPLQSFSTLDPLSPLASSNLTSSHHLSQGINELALTEPLISMHASTEGEQGYDNTHNQYVSSLVLDWVRKTPSHQIVTARTPTCSYSTGPYMMTPSDYFDFCINQYNWIGSPL